MTNSQFPKIFFLSPLKLTTRSQKRNAVAELASGDFEASIAENNTTENLVAGPSKNPRIEPENLEETKNIFEKRNYDRLN